MKKIKRHRHRTADSKIFAPSIDWWVIGIVVFFIIMLSSSIPAIIWSGAPFLATTAAVIVIVATIVYICDLAFYTHYQIEKDGLLISSQLRHVFFPYRAMKKVKKGSVINLLSIGKRKRFALSARCLVISLDEGIWTTISVSPRLKDEFLDQIATNIKS